MRKILLRVVLPPGGIATIMMLFNPLITGAAYYIFGFSFFISTLSTKF